MTLHVVLFRPRTELTVDDLHALAGAFSTAINDIPSVRRAQIGRRILLGRPYEQLMQEDYTHAAVLEFDDLAGLTSYLEHPAHERLGALFLSCFEQALVYDFQTIDGDRAVDALLTERGEPTTRD